MKICSEIAHSLCYFFSKIFFVLRNQNDSKKKKNLFKIYPIYAPTRARASGREKEEEHVCLRGLGTIAPQRVPNVRSLYLVSLNGFTCTCTWRNRGKSPQINIAFGGKVRVPASMLDCSLFILME